jgi:alpha-1,3-mannosyl-glycoprotein beta-1,2-N-acetylglucosaminyltransferase
VLLRLWVSPSFPKSLTFRPTAPSRPSNATTAGNDNGQEQHVSDVEAIYRSSFFSGLGWMLHRRAWLDLEPKWPKAYWDDWLREPPQQRGREVLRPEICRTYHFASQGVSNNQYSDFLTSIRLNDVSVDWAGKDLSYLQRTTYDEALARELDNAPLVSLAEARQGLGGGWDGPQNMHDVPVRVEYGDVRQFASVARKLGIMDNVKANVPRVAYHGVVTVRLGRNKRKVHVSLPLAKTGLLRSAATVKSK